MSILWGIVLKKMKIHTTIKTDRIRLNPVSILKTRVNCITKISKKNKKIESLLNINKIEAEVRFLADKEKVIGMVNLKLVFLIFFINCSLKMENQI
jgi:hypothetical protein